MFYIVNFFRYSALVMTVLKLKDMRVATCKPGKFGLTSFSETLALFFIQFLSFRKMKIQDRQNGPSKLFCYVTFLLCLGPW